MLYHGLLGLIPNLRNLALLEMGGVEMVCGGVVLLGVATRGVIFDDDD
jgi:hypothetical protein